MLEYQKYDCQIIFTQYLQTVLDHFSACFGIRIAFFNTRGQELKVGMRQGICEYCKHVRGELNLLDNCRANDHAKMTEAAAGGQIVSYHCHAGLREIIKPVYLDRLLIGYIMIGQFRDSSMPSAAIRREWLLRKKPERDLNNLYQQVPFHGRDKVKHITGIFEALVDSTVDKQAYKLKDEEPMFKLKNYLFRHVAQNVSLDQAATFLNWSKSKLTHTIKQKAGQSFKKLQLEIKFAVAEQLISEKNVSIAEAGYSVGFHDPGYFSRIYKKYRGIPPTKFMPNCVPGSGSYYPKI